MNKRLIKPVIIIGAPRSGTSTLQMILRHYPGFWSLPSESDMIWDLFCHPALRKWSSEYMSESNFYPSLQARIHREFNRFLCPSSFWDRYGSPDVIWSFDRNQRVRKLFKPLYRFLFPVLQFYFRSGKNRRMVEKTASNCFRLGFVNEVFPDALFVYITRDGRNNVNSLINAWLHPSRFFTYDLPEEIHISGCPHKKWKFVLPPGWREYLNCSLEEVCAFQWRACHAHVLKSIQGKINDARVYRMKLEDLQAKPVSVLQELARFCEIEYNAYLESLAKNLPVVNSQDRVIMQDKWKAQNRERIERILPEIEPMMKELGYNE